MTAPKPISGATKILTLLGNPVTHSLSPRMHNGWLSDAGIDAAYVALPVSDAAAIAAIGGLGLMGANVTVPHKEAAFRAAARADAVATALQAANVLRVEADGSLSAFNTDAPGFIAALNEAHPEWRLVRRRNILVLGAGGSARAVCHGLLEAGAQRLLLANRTPEKAQALAQVFGQAIEPIALDAIGDRLSRTDMIINCISDDAAITWPFDRANARPLCIDLRYGAMRSHFLQQARASGFPIMDGLGMLVHQGALSFEIWFGVKPDIEAAYRRLSEALA